MRSRLDRFLLGKRAQEERMTTMSLGQRFLIALAPVAAAVWAMGCATTASRAKLAPARLAQADSAIQAAEEAGATAKNPSAALHLRMAREENEAAKHYAAENH